MRCVCALFILTCSVFISAAEYSVRVESGDHAYTNVIVTAKVPDDSFPKSGRLLSSKEAIFYQRSGDGTFTFVLPRLEKQAVARFTVVPGPDPNLPSAAADLADGKITLSVGGKKAFVYQGEESALPRENIKPQFKRGGYIHPVYSPSGRLITDDYPANHVHHHGIWFPWTKTVFEGRTPDFWNMGESKGKVEFAKFGKNWSGQVHAGFEAEHRFVDLTAPEPKTALNESWKVTAYNIGGNYFVFDLVSIQTCATSSPLQLPKYHYGGLGFRGNWAWNGADKCFFLTSNGETDRKKANETRGNWCHISGEVDGQLTGLAILSHPDNFRSPQPMRLHPSEPFFCFAPSQEGDWSIEPGKPYVSKYRFIVSDGAPDKRQIDALWKAYAHPPKVVVEKR